MLKNNTKLLDNANLIMIGIVIGVVFGVILGIIQNKDYTSELERNHKNMTAFKEYYHNVETLLDSLDYTYSLCLEDGALQSTAGEDYLDAKAKVDSLIFKQY